MIIRFVDEAKTELLEAISYYEDFQVGLGRRLRDEINRCILLISEQPELYRLRIEGYRRINCQIFPYYIPYIVRDSTLWVLAIAHGHRKPKYWIRHRLNKS